MVTAPSAPRSSGVVPAVESVDGGLATLRVGSSTRVGIRVGEHYRLLPHADVGELVAEPGWRDTVAAAVADRAGAPGTQTVPAAGADHAPVISNPRKVLCCGHNYVGHINEMGRGLPTHPTIFGKFADTLTGAGDEIVLPAAAGSIDWEAELAVVIGMRIRHADRTQARAAIAGYTVANDVSSRTWQRHTGQWLPGKAFDATTPIGPVLVTDDRFDPSSGAAIRCIVNGEVVQESHVDDLLFDAAELISYVSTFTALSPGDVVLTGTPAGVGAGYTPPRYLADGDVVTTEIDGIGRCANRIGVDDN